MDNLRKGDGFPLNIGEKIREQRILRGLTQEELASRTELSKGFISQLERNLTSPSIATLTDILQCLGMTLGEFFQDEPEEQVVFRGTDYFEKNDAELGSKVTWIIPNAQKHGMEPILLRLAPGGSTCPDHPHEGEEFGYVFRGSVDIHLGSRVYRAKKGESFYFVSDRRHYLTSRQGAEILWISSPPSF
jgi:transcriptional regulator with XRE-family HTH domain